MFIPKSRPLIVAMVSFVLLGISAFYVYGRSLWVPAVQVTTVARTVSDVVSTFGPEARARMKVHFYAAGVQYPPKRVTLLAVKDSAQLELWTGPESAPTYVHTYPIRALSGLAGPKLREGDRQVPEGIYRIAGFNPNSRFHLSMKLNYPNDFDLVHARAEGRSEPGTNIFIHGRAVSIGCLAMGDSAIEELFVLAADIGRANVQVVIAPTDPRKGPLAQGDSPSWVSDLYQMIETKFTHYQK